MKLRTSKVLSLIPSLLLFAGTAAFADAVVTPSAGPVGPGQQFTVAINITGPTVKGVTLGASDVYAFQLDVTYPSSLVRAKKVDDGTFFSGAGNAFFSPGEIDNGSGTVSHIFGTLVTSPAGASGSGTLVNITFQTVAAGTPQITISNLTLLDSSLNPIVIDDTPDQVTTTATVTTAEMQTPKIAGKTVVSLASGDSLTGARSCFQTSPQSDDAGPSAVLAVKPRQTPLRTTGHLQSREAMS